MDPKLGPICVPDNKRSYSKAMGNLIDNEARKIVAQSYQKTEQLLKDNADKLSKVNHPFATMQSRSAHSFSLFSIELQLAEALLERETLNYEDVVELIGEPKYSAATRKVEPVEFEESIKKLSSDDTKSV